MGNKGNSIFFSDLLVIKRLFESMLVFLFFFAQMYLPQGQQNLELLIKGYSVPSKTLKQ
jgi:hypothetical protein